MCFLKKLKKIKIKNKVVRVSSLQDGTLSLYFVYILLFDVYFIFKNHVICF